MEYTVEEVKEKIRTNRIWAERALLRLYSLQVEQERQEGITILHNGVGFNATDAPFLTSLAEYHRENGRLTRNQLRVAQKILPKYARQLLEVGKG